MLFGQSGWFWNPAKLDPKIASLYYAADRRFALSSINKILDSGAHLFVDRYYHSNMGHQGGKIRDKEEREKMFSWIQKLELDLLEIPPADAVIFLHMPYQVGIELGKKMEEKPDAHELDIEHLKNAEESYLHLQEFTPNWYTVECAPDGTINSLRTEMDIHEEVYRIAKIIIDDNK